MRTLLVTLFAATATLNNPAALRDKIQQTFHVPNPLPALDVQTHGSFEVEAGIVADRVTYNTQLNMRVPAIVYHPADTSVKRPAIIIVNGHGGDKYTWYAFYAGVMYARAGAVVITYDPIGEGERNSQHKSGTRAHDKYVPPDENGRWMGGLMMTDIRQATSYLIQRPDVDAGRVAMTGYSMGSFVTSWACAVETRVHACAPTAGAVLDEPGGTLDSSSKKMCQSIPYQSLQFLGDRGPAIFALAAQHAAVLIHNGSSDEVVNIPTHGEEFFRDMRDRTAKLLGPDGKKVFEYSFTPDGGHRPYFITRPVAEWFNKQLHFSNWDAISRDETHISEWAAKNDVPMDKMYATEHREGGAIALGKNIPNIPHDKLNVFPESEWKNIQREKFILEIWLERVRQASSSAQLSYATVCDVTKYGATGNGRSLDTAAIQKAIDACNASGGGTVLFGASSNGGKFLSGTIFLKSNVTLRIEPGAVLLGSTNIADFGAAKASSGEVADEVGAHHVGYHFIYADNVDNVAIEGGGVIDGQGDTFFDKDMKARPRPSPYIEIWNSRDIRIQDITIRKTPGWAIHPKNCDRVKIRGINLINNFMAINTDGIDPDSSRNVIISDSYIEAGDDCIVLKTTNRGGVVQPCENVAVTNCVLLSAASALKLGTESWGDFRHCVFSNCVIRQARTGIALLAKDGGTMEDIRFQNITMQTQPKWGKGVEWPIQFDIEKRAENSKISHIRDVSLSDITMVTKGRVLIEGMPESLIDMLTMRNVIMRVTGYEQIKNAHKNRGGNGGLKDAVDFGSVPSALIFGNARNVDLNDIHVIWPDGPAEKRTGLFTSNVSGLSTSNMHTPDSK